MDRTSPAAYSWNRALFSEGLHTSWETHVKTFGTKQKRTLGKGVCK